MLRVCKYLLILLFTLGVVWFSNGQSRIELQRMIEKNKNDIKLTREILRETQNQKVASLQLLNVYQNQIVSRKALISGIGYEVESIDSDIEIAREEISAITRELNDMKSEFSVLIQDGYKSQKNHSKILFLFSSNNFNQLFKRMHYLRKLLDYRKLQLELILRKQQENSHKVNALVNKKNQKLVLLRNREAEQSKLIQDQNREEEIIQELKEKEADLLISIRQKQKQADELDKWVKQIIEQENNEDFIPAPSKELSGNFENNRGRLPWPVKNGYINEVFGVHKHAELKNITTENNGVNITTTPGSEVFPVFDGMVVAIMEVPGLKNSILIKHRGYYTVYANLGEVFIKRGDLLQVGTRIGRVVKDDDGLAELHFEVWKGTNKLDPQRWLRN